MVHIDEEALRSSLKRLRQAAFDADVVAVLKRTVNAVDDVFGYNGAGIMFITESGQLAYVAASEVFNFYVRRFAEFPKVYGALAGFVVLMLWIYMTSLILLIGAETERVMEAGESRAPA